MASFPHRSNNDVVQRYVTSFPPIAMSFKVTPSGPRAFPCFSDLIENSVPEWGSGLSYLLGMGNWSSILESSATRRLSLSLKHPFYISSFIFVLLISFLFLSRITNISMSYFWLNLHTIMKTALLTPFFHYTLQSSHFFCMLLRDAFLISRFILLQLSKLLWSDLLQNNRLSSYIHIIHVSSYTCFLYNRLHCMSCWRKCNFFLQTFNSLREHKAVTYFFKYAELLYQTVRGTVSKEWPDSIVTELNKNRIWYQ